MESLKEDPELAHVFADIRSSGPSAMERYWNDTELMTKISAKMAALGVAPQAIPVQQTKSLPVRGEHDGSAQASTCAQASLPP